MKLKIRSGLPGHGRALSTQPARRDRNCARKPSAEARWSGSGWCLQGTLEPPTPCLPSTHTRWGSAFVHPRALGSRPGRPLPRLREPRPAVLPSRPREAGGRPLWPCRCRTPGLGAGAAVGGGVCESPRATQPLLPRPRTRPSLRFLTEKDTQASRPLVTQGRLCGALSDLETGLGKTAWAPRTRRRRRVRPGLGRAAGEDPNLGTQFPVPASEIPRADAGNLTGYCRSSPSQI